MSALIVRPGVLSDLAATVEIYNHYILTTPITFDVDPYTVDARRPWFEQFAPTGRHRLLIAEDAGRVVGYACTMRHRPKPAYETSVEFSVYCAEDRIGSGVGRVLYGSLLDAVRGEDLHRALAGITEGNPRSIEFHRRFGFREIGRFTEQGRKFGRYWDVIWMERPLP